MRQIAYTVFSFCYFLGLAVELTVIGFLTLTIGGKTDENKRKYHQLLQRRARFVVNHIPGTTFSYKNQYNETFDKPAVIVSNHQSHIDLMAIMMLTPNLIILTKDWVWHNPFYGFIIRYADFMPVGDIEQMISRLKPLVEKGYSIMVFPEGTRSVDCHVQRFHRGAFYLAERLHLDIIPIFINGFGKVLPKTAWSLRSGHLTVEVLQRICRDNAYWNCEYREMTKRVRHIYQEKL